MRTSMEVIESVQNPKVKNWVKLLSKKGRMSEHRFLIEGEHLVEEAIKSNMPLAGIIVQANLEARYNRLDMREAPLYRVTEAVMNKLSDTQTPQGICAIVEMQTGLLEDVVKQNSLLLILDALQDPGNLGTIIRTADSAGVDGVILGKGCVDLYNPKTIRATMGSLFHIPIVEQDLQQVLPFLKNRGYQLIATSLEGAVAYDQCNYRGASAIVIGNEANGVSKWVLEQCDKRVKIPIYGRAESLNAAIAAGIILYESVRQRKDVALSHDNSL